MSYRFHEDVSMADVAFSAEARTFAGLLEEAAKATFEVMVKLDTVHPRETREISLKAATPEKLLFAWLEELVYLKDAEAMVFSSFAVTVTEDAGLELRATAKGEKINQEAQTLHVDVKAVTYHRFEVAQEKGKWRCFVILDI